MLPNPNALASRQVFLAITLPGSLPLECPNPNNRLKTNVADCSQAILEVRCNLSLIDPEIDLKYQRTEDQSLTDHNQRQTGADHAAQQTREYRWIYFGILLLVSA